MKSRVFCCNGGLIRRDLAKSALLWGAYLLLWFVSIPANLLSSADWMKAIDMRELVLDSAAGSCHGASAFYGMLVAWFLFSYLHKTRSANFFAALPLRRETQFLSHYMSGLLYSFLPNLVISGTTILAGAFLGVNLVAEAAIWLGAHSLTFLFYYSLAVLCSMVVGNVIAMPVLYLILNFVAVVVETLCRTLMEALLYGVSLGYEMCFGWLSPLYYFPLEGNGPDCVRIFERENLTDLVFTGWESLLILGAVGLVLAAIAFLFYRRRPLEAAGDVIAVKQLRPVFLYVFTFGCAIVIGSLLASILVQDMDSSSFLAISLCLLAGSVVGHFLGHMILQRSLRIFNRRHLVSCGICMAVLATVLGAMKLDLFGVVRYVPDLEDVAAVRLESGRHDVEDPQRIKEVIDLHQQIIDRKSETETLCRQSYYKPMLDIVYKLENGREVRREYRLPVTDGNYGDPDSLLHKYDVVNNTPEMILSRETPTTAITEQTVLNCNIYYNAHEDGVEHIQRLEPKAVETVRLWETAIRKDLKAGNMGKFYYEANFEPSSDRSKVEVEENVYSDVSVEIQLIAENGLWDYCLISIPDSAVHTKTALMEMGVPEAAFGK